MINPDRIPDDVRESLDMYAEKGMYVGDFLRAVLENKLFEAVSRADYVNIRFLPEICSYIYNRLPRMCWGSEEAVNQWILKKKNEKSSNQNNL